MYIFVYVYIFVFKPNVKILVEALTEGSIILCYLKLSLYACVLKHNVQLRLQVRSST